MTEQSCKNIQFLLMHQLESGVHRKLWKTFESGHHWPESHTQSACVWRVPAYCFCSSKNLMEPSFRFGSSREFQSCCKKGPFAAEGDGRKLLRQMCLNHSPYIWPKASLKSSKGKGSFAPLQRVFRGLERLHKHPVKSAWLVWRSPSISVLEKVYERIWIHSLIHISSVSKILIYVNFFLVSDTLSQKCLAGKSFLS